MPQSWTMALAAISDMGMQWLEVDVLHRNSALSACEKGASGSTNAWCHGMLLYSPLKRTGSCSHESVSICVCAHRNRKRWQQSLFQVYHLPLLRLPPQSIVFNALVDSLEKTCRWREGVQLMHVILAQRIALDSFFYSSLLTAVGKMQPSRIWSLLSGERSVKLDAVACAAAIQGCTSPKIRPWLQLLQQLGLWQLESLAGHSKDDACQMR
eukprot:symbB.v1.2.007296.t1/scaffold443.1/size206750/9